MAYDIVRVMRDLTDACKQYEISDLNCSRMLPQHAEEVMLEFERFVKLITQMQGEIKERK